MEELYQAGKICAIESVILCQTGLVDLVISNEIVLAVNRLSFSFFPAEELQRVMDQYHNCPVA